MPSLLDLCRQAGLAPPGDYYLADSIAVLTEAGQAKLLALAAADPPLAEALLAASGGAIEAVLAGHPRLSRQQRRQGERLLAKGRHRAP